MQANRVVITGMGAITPLGSTIETLWDNLTNGRSGVGKITSFDTSSYDVQIAAEVKDFDAALYMGKKDARRMDRYAQFGCAAVKLAIANAELEPTKYDPTRVGVYIASGIGGLSTLEEQHERLLTRGPKRVSPFFIPMLMGNAAAGYAAIQNGFKGPNFAIVSACTSSTHAIGESWRMLRMGEADIMLAGGAEATILPMAVAGFSSMEALASSFNDSPSLASRPFDKNREGFVMGEGAGVLVLERLEHAISRGANIVAEVCGYGSSADAYHLTSPHPEGEGAIACMQQAISSAGLSLTDVDYINAHGTSTVYNDQFETIAIKTVFKEHAKKLAVSSTKSMLGHLLGASGGVEAISAALTIERQLIPPTINHEVPDPECDLDYVPNVARSANVRVALSNSFGFGGHNATIAFKRFEG